MKYVRQPRLYAPLAAALVLGAFAAFGPTQNSGVSAQQAPPAPPGPAGVSTPAPTFAPLSVSPSSAPSALGTPTPTPTPGGRHHRGASPAPSSTATPEPTSTPTSPAFATLDGTWEVQLQYTNGTTYSYLTIAQQATGTISGTWKIDGKDNPFEGTYDGRLIRMLVKRPAGNVTMSGYVEGASDMVGLVDFGGATTSGVAFTAEHRGGDKGGLFKKK